MSLVSFEGLGVWIPTIAMLGALNPAFSALDTALLDATNEEAQAIGTVTIDGGGSKTFGTSGSKIGWLPGPSITFASGSTLRVGLKHTAQISTTTGPPARATLGQAAFNVYDDLVGGTDTITATTWRDDPMTAGTPLTVSDGDLLAVCFHLTVSSGTPSVKIRGALASTASPHLPLTVLLTAAGATVTQLNGPPNIILTFNDGTLGWFAESRVLNAPATAASAIGINNSIGNIVRVPFPCVIDAIAIYQQLAAAADCDLQLWDTPLGTPSLRVTVPVDGNVTATAAIERMLMKRLPTPQTLEANTDYAIALKQTTANAITPLYMSVALAAHNKPNGMGEHCYAANSTAGATFVSQGSGLRRYLIWMRVCAVEDGAAGALRTSSPMRRQALRFARSGR